MKKSLIILALITIISSCSKDDDDGSTTLQFESSVLEATGDLSEQSSEEAKKTIYGKWNFPSSFSARSACKWELVSLEFTGQNYFMTLDAGYNGAISGKFTLGENASGKVEKVELKSIFDDNSEIVVAVLTNMVVTKTGDDLNATFNLVLTFPNDSGEYSTFSFSSCNDALSGNIEAKKAEPMAESKNASADSNHAKFIGTWKLVSATNWEGEKVDLKKAFNEACEDVEYNPDTGEYTAIIIDRDFDCIPASSAVIEISSYGTYNSLLLDAKDGVLSSTYGIWKWKDNTQKVIMIGNDDDKEEDRGEVKIISISTSEMSIENDDGTFLYKKV